MKRVEVSPAEYLFGHRGRPLSVAPYVVRDTWRLRAPVREVWGLAIAPDSEVRGVRVHLAGEWAELVEGAPLPIDPRTVRAGEIELDGLDRHDGFLRLAVAESCEERAYLPRHVAAASRLTMLPGWPPYHDGITYVPRWGQCRFIAPCRIPAGDANARRVEATVYTPTQGTSPSVRARPVFWHGDGPTGWAVATTGVNAGGNEPVWTMSQNLQATDGLAVLGEYLGEAPFSKWVWMG